MKKLTALTLSLLLLLGCLSGGEVFAYTKDTVSEAACGDTVAINVAYTNLDKTLEQGIIPEDAYYIKFVPEQSGYYEFKFDRKFSGGKEDALISAVYSMEENTFLATAMCMTITADIQALAAYYGVTDNPSVASYLKAGKPYALYILSTVKKGFAANVTVQGHVHQYKTMTVKSCVDEDDISWSKDGEKYVGCTVNNCTYHKKKETYFRVKSVKLSKTKYTYDGKAKKPAVTVKDRKGNKLKKDRDYTVKYKSNKKVGTAYVTVKFKGNYEGTHSKTFKINPKETSLTKVSAGRKAFTARWKKQTAKTTGYQLQYSTDKTFKKKKQRKTKTVAKNTATYKTVTGLKAKKTYYVRVRTYKKVDGTKYYSGWSKAVKVKTR